MNGSVLTDKPFVTTFNVPATTEDTEGTSKLFNLVDGEADSPLLASTNMSFTSATLTYLNITTPTTQVPADGRLIIEWWLISLAVVGTFAIVGGFAILCIWIHQFRSRRRSESDPTQVNDPLKPQPVPVLVTELTESDLSDKPENSPKRKSRPVSKGKRKGAKRARAASVQPSVKPIISSLWAIGKTDSLVTTLAHHRKVARRQGNGTQTEDHSGKDAGINSLGGSIGPSTHPTTDCRNASVSTRDPSSGRRKVLRTASQRNRDKVSSAMKTLKKTLPPAKLKALEAFLLAHPEDVNIIAGMIKTEVTAHPTSVSAWSLPDSLTSLIPDCDGPSLTSVVIDPVRQAVTEERTLQQGQGQPTIAGGFAGSLDPRADLQRMISVTDPMPPPHQRPQILNGKTIYETVLKQTQRRQSKPAEGQGQSNGEMVEPVVFTDTSQNALTVEGYFTSPEEVI